MLMRLQTALVVALLVWCTASFAQAESPAMAPAPLLNDAGFRIHQPQSGDATVQPLVPSAAATIPGEARTGLRIDIRKPVDPYYNLQLIQPVAAGFDEGRLLHFSFWARSATGNPLRAVIALAHAPWTPVGTLDAKLAPQWERISGTFTTYASHPPKDVAAYLQVGHQAGTIELAGITLEDRGLDPRWVTTKKALEPAAIATRIRTHRMAELTVRVVDAQGKPVPGAAVHIEQTSHAFLFGANIFNLQPANREPWQKAYQERFVVLFNFATLPFYWGGFEPELGAPLYAHRDAMAHWCKGQGLIVKGHPLIWHEVYPKWAPATADQAVPLLQRRVTEIIGHYKGDVAYWDVFNEANSAAAFKRSNGETDWVKRDGPLAAVQASLTWARQAAATITPPPTLLYNDFDVGPKNLALLKQLQERSALPDAIGIQSHMHHGRWSRNKTWQVVEDFAQFGRPIHFTEVTVLSGPIREFDYDTPPSDWTTTPQDEAMQTEYIEQFYTDLFSHPAVRAITWWDFSDRHAWLNAPAGLLRKDMSPKPVYVRLLKLIRGQWWTNARGTTGADGAVTQRAFHGDYRITVTGTTAPASGKRITASLPMTGDDQTVTVTLP